MTCYFLFSCLLAQNTRRLFSLKCQTNAAFEPLWAHRRAGTLLLLAFLFRASSNAVIFKNVILKVVYFKPTRRKMVNSVHLHHFVLAIQSSLPRPLIQSHSVGWTRGRIWTANPSVLPLSNSQERKKFRSQFRICILPFPPPTRRVKLSSFFLVTRLQAHFVVICKY